VKAFFDALVPSEAERLVASGGEEDLRRALELEPGNTAAAVALARALVAGARVLVLDDPMSAVDTETERLLVENLRPAVAGRTVLVATQRLSTIGVADRAVVLQDGRIVEHGRPHELLRRGGPFTALFGDETLAA
jgi:ATP-binding cassette subfamily B protein